MTKADIYKAISDLIADSDGASIDYIVGVNDMGRYLAEQCKDTPASAPDAEPKEIHTQDRPGHGQSKSLTGCRLDTERDC